MAEKKTPGRKAASLGFTHHEAIVSLGRVLVNAEASLPKEPASITVRASAKNPESGKSSALGELSVSRGGIRWSRRGRRVRRLTWVQFADLMARDDL